MAEEIVTDPNPNANGVVPPVVPDADSKPETVSKVEFERVMRDLHRHKERAAAAEQKAKELEVNGMKSKEQYKELYEQTHAQLETKDKELNSIKHSIVFERKQSALKTEALQIGLRSEAVDDLEKLDLEDVLVEVAQSTDGKTRVSVVNAKQVAEKLKLSKPHWFAAKGAPSVNTSSPSVVNTGDITLEDVKSAQAAWRKDPKNKAAEQKYLEIMHKFQKKG